MTVATTHTVKPVTSATFAQYMRARYTLVLRESMSHAPLRVTR